MINTKRNIDTLIGMKVKVGTKKNMDIVKIEKVLYTAEEGVFLIDGISAISNRKTSVKLTPKDVQAGLIR